MTQKEWLGRIDEVSELLRAWWERNSGVLFTDESIELAYTNAKNFLDRARVKVNAAGVEYELRRIDGVVAPLVEYALDTVKMAPPSWLTETLAGMKSDVADVLVDVRDTVKSPLLGAGIGTLVAVGVFLWLMSRGGK